jgi:hypothetical protein
MEEAMYAATAFGSISLCLFFAGVISVIGVLAR